jgi:leader peptidase (prepilin peptidase)/N-methyltransferase
MTLTPTIIFGISAAPFVGSFLCAVVDRLPTGRSIILGQSCCDSCQHVLGTGDLLPFLSWIISGAKCRYCGTGLSLRYPMMEAGALAIAILSAISVPESLFTLSVIFCWVLMAQGVMDLRFYLLADSLTAILAIGGLTFAATASPFAVTDHVAGAAIGGVTLHAINVVYRSIRKRNGLGRGDIKLFAAIGMWVGWQSLPSVVLYAVLSAFTWIMFRMAATGPVRADSAVPFGFYLCLGAWLTWQIGPLDFASLN